MRTLVLKYNKRGDCTKRNLPCTSQTDTLVIRRDKKSKTRRNRCVLTKNIPKVDVDPISLYDSALDGLTVPVLLHKKGTQDVSFTNGDRVVPTKKHSSKTKKKTKKKGSLQKVFQNYLQSFSRSD